MNCFVKAGFDNKQQGVSEEIMEPNLELESDLELPELLAPFGVPAEAYVCIDNVL